MSRSKKKSQFNPDEPIPVDQCTLFNKISSKHRNSVIELQNRIGNLLDVVDKSVFYHYTTHDLSHAQRTLGTFCEILSRVGVNDELSSEEAMISICACIIHDIGMGPITPEEKADLFADRISDETKNNWRLNHHDRVLEWVRRNDEGILDFLNDDQREAIGHVSQAHRIISLQFEKYFEERDNLRFLGAVLRLADQMDLSPLRIKQRLDSKAPSQSLLRLLETADSLKHEKQILESLKNFPEKKWTLTQSENDERILKLEAKVNFDKLTHATLAALDDLTGDIEKTIEETQYVTWKGNRVLPTNLEVVFNVESQFSPHHQLSANYREVWRYLSAKIYPKEIQDIVPIREAIANALDACALLPTEEKENAKVIVRDLGHSIQVEDNGIGIDLDVIENHLKVLGSSYYTSPKFRGWLNKQGNIKPNLIGQFGIGTFSYLLVSGSYSLDTMTVGGQSYHVNFSMNFGVTTMSSRKERGTLLTIPCNPEKRPQRWKDSQELLQLIGELFPLPHTPIVLQNESGEEIPIGNYYEHEGGKIRIDIPRLSCSFRSHTSTEDGDGFEIGFTINADFSEINLELNPANLLFYRWQEDERKRDVGNADQTNIRLKYLYSGMVLDSPKQTIAPCTIALLSSLDNYSTISDNRLETITVETDSSMAWIDFDPESIEITLTKQQFEEISPTVSYATQVIDVITQDLINELLKSPYTPWPVKDRIRIVILNNLYQLPIGRTVYWLKGAIDDREKVLESLRNHLKNGTFRFEYVISSLQYLDVNKNKIMSLETIANSNLEKTVYIVGAFTPFFMQGHTSGLSRSSPVPLISFLRKGRKAAKKAISYRKRLQRPTILWSLGLGEWVDILAREYLLFKGIKNVQTGGDHWEERTGLRW